MADLTKPCPQCGAAAPLDAVYCPRCGYHEAPAPLPWDLPQTTPQTREEFLRTLVYDRDTGMGACPQCGSRNLQQGADVDRDNSLAMGAGCLGCLVSFPLMLIAPLLSRTTKHRYRACRACGHRWGV